MIGTQRSTGRYNRERVTQPGIDLFRHEIFPVMGTAHEKGPFRLLFSDENASCQYTGYDVILWKRSILLGVRVILFSSVHMM